MASPLSQLSPPNIALLDVTGKGMYPSTLLTVKLLWLTSLVFQLLEKMQVPFLPLFRPMDALMPWSVELSAVLQIVYFCAGIALLFNYRPRLCCTLLAGCIVVLLLANRTTYRNHIFVIACAYLLAACHKPQEPPWLLVWQLSLVYLAAGLNKAWEPDWLSGQFMHNWLSGYVNWYDVGTQLLPELVFGQCLAIGTILFEVTLGLMLLKPKLRPLAIWLAAGFHFGLYIAVKGTTFGYFLHDAMILLLAFIPWPNQPLRLDLPAKVSGCQWLLRWLDTSRQLEIVTNQPTFCLSCEGHFHFTGLAALRSLLLRLPVLPLALLVLMIGLQRYAPDSLAYVVTNTTFLICWLGALPDEARPMRKRTQPAQTATTSAA